MLSQTINFEEMVVNTMKDASGGFDLKALFDSEKVERLYAMAYGLYGSKHYTDASYFFRMLLVANPRETKYWKGLGACLHMNGEHQEAINCYVCAQLLTKDQPDPMLYIHAADCYFATGQIDAGIKALDGALLSAQEKMDEKIVHHVELMKEMWTKRQ